MKRKNIKYLIIGLLLCALFSLLLELNHSYVQKGAVDPENYTASEDHTAKTYTCASLFLGEGTYQITLFHRVTETASWTLMETQQNDGTNHLGRLLSSGEIEKGTTETKIKFTLKENVGEVRLKFASPNSETIPLNWKVACLSDTKTDNLFIFLTMAVFVCLLFFCKNPKKAMPIILLTGTAIFITTPYFTSFLKVGHDLGFHLNRILGMESALRAGEFPARYNDFFNNGYGYLNSLTYPELFLYFPAILCVLGVSIMSSYKFLLLGVNIATALVGYYSFKRLFHSQRFAFFCSFLYLLNPYRLNNLFLRAAVGEVLGAIFLPLLALGVYELVCRDYKKWWLTVIAATGLLQSHFLSVEISVIFVLIFLILCIKQFFKKEGFMRVFTIIKAGVSIVLINMWFLLPFLEQLFTSKYKLLNSDAPLAPLTAYLHQMFLSNFKVAGPAVQHGIVEEMPLTIGIVLAVGSFIYLYYAYIKKSVSQIQRKFGTVCIILGAFSIYMASELFPWHLVDNSPLWRFFLSPIQFPWRMLGFASLFLCIVTAIALEQLLDDDKKVITGCMLLVSAQLTLTSMDGYMTELKIYLTSRNSMPESSYNSDYYTLGTDHRPMKTSCRKLTLDEEMQISEYTTYWGGLSFNFQNAHNAQDKTITLPLYNYGVFQAYLDGEEIPIIESSLNHAAALTIPENVNKGAISIQYSAKNRYRKGDLISAVFILLCGGYYICRAGIRKRKKRINSQQDGLSEANTKNR